MNMLWLQSAGCGGCTMSLLCAEDPNVFDTLSGAGIKTLWHPALSLESGGEVRALLDSILSGDTPLDILCVEGSIARGPKGTGRYHILSGTGKPMLDWVRDLSAVAQHVVAVGTCAAYGGVTTAGGNPSDSAGLQYEGNHPGGILPPDFRARAGLPVINVAGCPTHPDWVRDLSAVAQHVVAVGTCAAYGGVTTAGGNPSDSAGLQYEGNHPGGILPPDFRARAGLPVINVAGCPTHPDWVTETLMLLAAGSLGAADLDALARPLFYAGSLVHHACPKNEFYEYKASARELSDMGCMMEHLGCVGTQAVGDCNIRPWNGQGSCTRGGYPCIACTAPEFEEPRHSFTETPKIGGIPVGLPSDMPKAWFMALASLSKAATPARVAKNATSDRIEVPPTLRKPRT